MNLKRLVRIPLFALSLSIIVPISLLTTQAHAVEGYAVIHPDGHVCGVIVGDGSPPWGGRLPIEYMGCPIGSRIVLQTLASETGNVAGTHGDGTNGTPLVTYEDTTRTFTVSNTSTTPTTSTTSTTSTTPVSTTVTMLIKDGVVTDSSGRSFNTGTGATTSTTLTKTQYVDFVGESKRIDSANNEQLSALNKSKELALQTPGVERCVTWQGYLENGKECSKASTSTIASGETSTVTSNSVKNTITESSKNVLKTDTSTAGVDSVTVTVKVKNEFETVTATVDTVKFEGKPKEIIGLSQKLETLTAIVSIIATAFQALDAIKSQTKSKEIKLPDSREIEQEQISETPKVCKIIGMTIVRLKKGTCEVSYTLTSLETGNSYSANKLVTFK